MSKKINLQLVMSALTLIQNKEKWNINKLVQKLNIDEKDLFYILSVITDIYSQQGELLIDYEYDDKNQELLFNFNPSLKNIIQINDGELFNLIFLLTSNSIFKELVKNNSDIEEFYNVVSPYFNLEILDESNDGVFENLTFFEENIISYIKLGSTEETFYRIQPILLTTNTDGIVLDYVDPANLVWSYTEDPNFQDCYYFGEVKKIKVNELKKQFPKAKHSFSLS